MTYKVLSSLTANNVNSADILKVKTDLLIIGVNKKTSSAELVFLLTPMINRSVLTFNMSAELTLFAVKLDKTL